MRAFQGRNISSYTSEKETVPPHATPLVLRKKMKSSELQQLAPLL